MRLLPLFERFLEDDAARGGGFMAGTPFILGDTEISKLAALKLLAEAHPVDMTDLMERLKKPNNKRQHMEQMSKQTVYLPFDYVVTYSKEINHSGGRTARHMSMSLYKEGRVPNQFAVWMVAEHLGFTGPHADLLRAEDNLKQCDAVWLEDLGGGGYGKAVNVLQLIESPS
jgi:hypothetical protein